MLRACSTASDRLSQPSWMAADGYVYANRRHSRLDRLAEVVAGLPSLEAVVVHGELTEGEPLKLAGGK